MGLISRVATTGLLALAIGGGYRLSNNRYRVGEQASFGDASRRSASGEDEYFSPTENLERIEIPKLRSAVERLRRLHHPLNIAMYAFTDRTVARTLIEEADAGTTVRVYRDGEQYESEERDAARYGRVSVSAMFHGHQNIHVRVKPASRVNLMHLKCWSDGEVLRDGSANWSTAGLVRQDNDLRFTTDPREVETFNRNFEALWNRPVNIVLQ